MAPLPLALDLQNSVGWEDKKTKPSEIKKNIKTFANRLHKLSISEICLGSIFSNDNKMYLRKFYKI